MPLSKSTRFPCSMSPVRVCGTRSHPQVELYDDLRTLIAVSPRWAHCVVMLVLVADDDRAVREALERALQLAGYDVQLASDGDAALAAIAQRTPHAVVLDVMMPGYDGLRVTRPLPPPGT